MAQIDAINHGVVLSLPRTARSRVVIYNPARITMPIIAKIRLGFEFIFDAFHFFYVVKYLQTV